LQQAAEFLRLFDQDSHDPRGLAREFENWCLENIWPWFEDQVHSDAALLARFRGEDVDLDSRLPSEVICDAIETDPSLLPVVGPYLVMRTQPASLRVIEARVRDLLRDGWRPHFASGPSRDELVALMEYTEMTQSRRAEIAMHA
jgi:hypothetical protein